ncbi:MAG TPA: DUF6491 family protein [Dokdonella sp.]|nr:DUF6491 family protein [Dokdonella sp.]
MNRRSIACALAACCLVASGARADTRETQRRNLERYTPYLQDPVESFPFWRLHEWQLVGPLDVVVWSTIKDAYLVRVRAPCPRLEWARSIAVTSKQSHQVSARFDEVLAGGDRCPIEQIRPIDLVRMRADAHDDARR